MEGLMAEESLQDEERRIAEGIREILSKYGKAKSLLIPILQLVQQTFGYLPGVAVQKVASHLGMTDAQVFGVASFYNYFRFTPLGKHPIQMCMGTACHMLGGSLVLEALERTLDIKVGEITEDRAFSLDRVACIGCCGLAPVMVIGDRIYPKMSPNRVDEAMVNLKTDAEEETDNEED
jgi:NADH-quinone oxidoreductase subunit E